MLGDLSPLPKTTFDEFATESDVEQSFCWPLLTSESFLGIPNGNIRTKYTISSILIDKGSKAKRYVPDYLIYVQGLPVLVMETKAPGEDLGEAVREAQLYAHTLNSRWASGISPTRFVIATDGIRLLYGEWDSAQVVEILTKDLLPASKVGGELRRAVGWPSINSHALGIIKKIVPSRFTSPHESLGETTVRLSKIPNNVLADDLIPVLQRYFQSENSDAEEEIVDKAYVSSDQITRYQRILEDFLREKVAPLSDSQAQELAPTKRDEPSLSGLISSLSQNRVSGGHLQLIIGGVGAGKSTFLRRYFTRLIAPHLRSKILLASLNFNFMPDDLSEVNRWVAESFIEAAFSSGDPALNREDPDCLRRIFSVEIRDNSGAYKFLRASSEEKYNERLGNDFLNWMADPIVFSKAIARHISGDRGKYIVVVFDNVDRRDRESQLSIFQTAQWFRRLTQSLCILCLRDETYETYKNEPPLDTFINSLHFYVRPPRFVDMVKKRLDLAIDYISETITSRTIDIPGLGRVRPKEQLGHYLRSVYVDLFQKQRRTTAILEGLSGRNVRHALEMFSNVLVSGHVQPSSIASTMFTGGEAPIRETNLIRALMRTNYLYFFDGHGFTRNIFDFSVGSKRPNHFLKIELLDFLAANRKRVGDARYEGYFSAEFLVRRFVELGFPDEDIALTLEDLLSQGLVIGDHIKTTGAPTTDLVRANVAGFVHLRVLAARAEYLSACALVTPISNLVSAREIGKLWQISAPRTDIGYQRKLQAVLSFKSYLEAEYRTFCSSSPLFATEGEGTRRTLRQMDDALGFTANANATVPRDDLFD